MLAAFPHRRRRSSAVAVPPSHPKAGCLASVGDPTRSLRVTFLTPPPLAAARVNGHVVLLVSCSSHYTASIQVTHLNREEFRVVDGGRAAESQLDKEW